MNNSFPPYLPPWFLRDGIIQTVVASYWYGRTWEIWRDRVWWMKGYPPLPWQEKTFLGAEDVPLWGKWVCPPDACGTIILTYGITGDAEQSWYAYLTAYKAYTQGWAVLLYDWRGHGKTAELSPTPSSDGWREGADQVLLAEQLVGLGCPPDVVLIGFSLGGQLALWGLKEARDTPHIKGAATLCPNLESNRSLDYLVSDPFGRLVERSFTQQLIAEVRRKASRFPEAVAEGTADRVDSIIGFDREIVINYYGFHSVSEYYQQTGGLYLLDQLTLPYLVVYAADDPVFDPSLVPEIKARIDNNPNGYLLLTDHGGHVAHISQKNHHEDQFWGINRLLEFANQLIINEPL